MSLILDALKKAQDERKAIFARPEKKSIISFERPRKTFYFILAGGLCLAIIIFLMPLPKKPPTNKEKQMDKIEKPLYVASNIEKKLEKIPKKEDNLKPPKLQMVEKKDGDIKILEELKRRTTPKAEINSEKMDKKDIQPSSGLAVDTNIVIKKDDPNKVTNMFNMATKEAERGNFEAAKNLYIKILEEKPNHIEALNNLGIIAMYHGNTNEALSYYRKILEILPNYARAYNNMGIIQLREGNKKLAEEYFKKAIELDKEGIEAYINLSALLRSEKRLEEASKLLESILSRGIEDANLYLSYAIIKDDLGDTKEAIKYYRYYMRHSEKSKERNLVIDRLKALEERDFTKSP